MNNDLYQNAVFDAIGADCFYEAISCALSYQGELYNALQYNFHHFIYNKESFLGYDFKLSPEMYLFENNKLLFQSVTKPFLKYRNDFGCSLSKLSQYYFNDYLIEMSFNDIKSISLILDNDLCICLLLDPFYLIEEYKKYNPRFEVHARHMGHYVNVFDIDISSGLCKIIDIHFKIKAEIPYKLLLLASKPYNYKCFYLTKALVGERNIANVIRKNLEIACMKSVTINSSIYAVNTEAWINFFNDFDVLVDSVFAFAKDITPQYISYPFMNFRPMQKSLHYLYKVINVHNKLEKLIHLLGEYSSNLYLYDAILDKAYLKNQIIFDIKPKLKKIVQQQLSISKEIDKEINLILNKWE